MTNSARRFPTLPHLRLIPMTTTDHDELRTDTLSPETDREEKTSPENTRPAIAPPARLPDSAELSASGLGSAQPPEWFTSSFIGQALSSFAHDADDLRKGRAAQHSEAMRKLDQVTQDMAHLALELNANLNILSQAFRIHRDASNQRLADGENRFAQIEKSIETVKIEILAELPDALHTVLAPYLKRIEDLETDLRRMKKDAARAATPPTA